MFTALIAEDSKPILRNIKALLQSADLPIQVVATAANGEEALEYIRRQPVDILLTDIRMPKLSGLALIEQAQLLRPQLKVLLISGYSDFEYTRKALNLQVFDYLLKPVELQQLIEVMERIIVSLNGLKDRDTEMFKGILAADFRMEMRLGEDFHEQDKVLLLLHKQPLTAGADSWGHSFIEACLIEAYAPHACWVFPTLVPQQLLVLVNASVTEKYPLVLEGMESARQHLLTHGLPVSIAAQHQPVAHGKLPESYQRVSELMREQLSVTSLLLLDSGYPMPLETIENGDMEQLVASFVKMIRQRQKERFALQLSQQLLKWQDGKITISRLERLIAVLLNTFMSAASELDQPGRRQLEEKTRHLLEKDSYTGFCAELLAWAEEGFRMLHAQNRKSGYTLFQQIDQYVRLNMYSHVSIPDLALKFHVSPSYISRIIKKCSQDTFVHYYMKLKIKEACRLIETRPELRIKELADLLSFSDQHYFSKVFKEYAGCSPTEYRLKSGLDRHGGECQ